MQKYGTIIFNENCKIKWIIYYQFAWNCIEFERNFASISIHIVIVVDSWLVKNFKVYSRTSNHCKVRLICVCAIWWKNWKFSFTLFRTDMSFRQPHHHRLFDWNINILMTHKRVTYGILTSGLQIAILSKWNFPLENGKMHEHAIIINRWEGTFWYVSTCMR